MTRLSVNINKVALIRNARGQNQPDIIKVARDLERFGAEGITVHPRPDQRHIRYDDIPQLKAVVNTEFNVEGNPTPQFMRLILENQPNQVTLVPDAPDALTSDSGWDTKTHKNLLSDIISQFKSAGIRTSIFLNDAVNMVESAAETGVDRIELYTGKYAHAFMQYGKSKTLEKFIQSYRETAIAAHEAGIGVNAGHDLNLKNLSFFLQEVPFVEEVSIGHAFVIDALYYGFENVVQMYLHQIKK